MYNAFIIQMRMRVHNAFIIQNNSELGKDCVRNKEPVFCPSPCLDVTDEDGEDEVIEELDGAEAILSVADVVLQEHDLTLVRSAVTLTVSGELDEPEHDELEDELEDDEDDESDLYEMLIQFRVEDQDYGLYIPLDPFFVVARLKGSEAVLVEGEEFDRVQARIEAELEEREQGL